MKYKILKIVYILLGIQILSYCFIGNTMLQYEIKANFEAFNERRLLNPYNKKVKEQYYFSSCGDEFFRDPEPRDMFFEKENFRIIRDTIIERISTISYHDNIDDIIGKETDDKERVNCIFFTLCKLNNLPFLYTKIRQSEIFTTHRDYHAMFYTDQIKEYEIHYIWVLFKWVKVKIKVVQ